MVSNIIGKYMINYLPLTVKGTINALPWIGTHFCFLSIYITFTVDITSIKSFQFQDGSQQISLAAKPLSLQHPCIFFKYMFMQLYCFEFFFIQIESLSVNVGKYTSPSKKDRSIPM